MGPRSQLSGCMGSNGHETSDTFRLIPCTLFLILGIFEISGLRPGRSLDLGSNTLRCQENLLTRENPNFGCASNRPVCGSHAGDGHQQPCHAFAGRRGHDKPCFFLADFLAEKTGFRETTVPLYSWRLVLYQNCDLGQEKFLFEFHLKAHC